MGRLEDGGQRVTLVPWPHPRVHPVRLQRAATAALSYDDYLASLEGEDAEEGGLAGSVLHRVSQLRLLCSVSLHPESGRSRLQVRVLLPTRINVFGTPWTGTAGDTGCYSECKTLICDQCPGGGLTNCHTCNANLHYAVQSRRPSTTTMAASL